ARALGRTVRRGDLWVASATTGAEALGTLVLRSGHCGTDPDGSDVDQRILERAALVTALLVLFRRSVAEAEGRVRGELLDDLISRWGPDPGALHERARRLGVDLAAPHVLVVARYEGHDRGQRQRAAFWAASHVALEHGLATSRGDEVVLLLPG